MNLVLLSLLAIGVVEAFVPAAKAPRSTISTLFETAHPVVYKNTVHKMGAVLKETKANLKELEALAKKLKSLEVMDPEVAQNSDAVLKALVAEAKAAVDTYGPDSPEAEAAWKDVDTEKISHPSYRYSESTVNHHHSYNIVVDTALLEDCIRSVETLLALDHFVDIEQKRLDGKNLTL